MAYEVSTNASGVVTAAPAVVGLFKHASDAHQAVAELRAQGFSSNQIGAAFRTRAHNSYTSDRTAYGDREQESWWDKVKDAFRGEPTETDRNDVHAAVVEPDAYSRGEYEYDYADQDVEGSLAGTGIPADRAAYLTRNLETGGAIVIVRDAVRAGEAEQILSANNGRVRHEEVANMVYNDTRAADTRLADTREVETEDEVRRAANADYTVGRTVDNPVPRAADAEYTDRRTVDTDYPDPRASDAGYVDRGPVMDAPATNADRMQLFGEVLRVHKDRISRGEVRVRKDVVTENQTMEVPVVREELLLERVAVTGDTLASSHNIGGNQEIRVPLTEEKVRLEKEAVLREEVKVGKREVADVAKVGGDVRHDELRVDSDPETPRRAVAGEELPSDARRHG